MTGQDSISGTTPDEAGQQQPSLPGRDGAGRVARLIRRNRLATAIVALLVAAAIAGVASGSLNGIPAASSAGSPALGDTAVAYAHPAPAPAFTLPGLTVPGRQVTPGQYQGRPLIVNFFASWCAPCQQETPLLARFYRQQDGRVTILGADASDTGANALAFVRAKGVTYLVGTDQTTTSIGGTGGSPASWPGPASPSHPRRPGRS
jgi:thiol-disulfide isomerase/thioredoxin